MQTAAISELKAYLSKYLNQVKEGEEVLITDRGHPVAKMVPVVDADLNFSTELLSLEKAGLARIGKPSLPDGFWRLPRPSDKKGAVLKALLEERESGR